MNSRAKVVVTDFITEPLDHERRILGDLADVVALEALSEDHLLGRIEDADAILLYHVIGLSAATIERLKKCKMIVRCGVGYDNVDLEAARKKGIVVANVPDYGTEEVADSAMGLLLSLTRGIHFLNSRLRRQTGPWSYSQVAPLWRIRGRTLGIVGMGRIGTAMALRARALGMEVVFHDPYAPDGREKSLGIRRVEHLRDLLPQCQMLSLHCPLSEETRYLINRQSLAMMPVESYLVNTARGGIVNTHSVLEALVSGHLAGAALDVLEKEPPLDNDPLLQAWRDPHHPAHDRLIINPHAAFYSEEGLLDMRIKGSENIRRLLRGEPAHNVVS